MKQCFPRTGKNSDKLGQFCRFIIVASFLDYSLWFFPTLHKYFQGEKIILLQILRPDLTLFTRDAWRHCAPTFGWEKTFIDLLFGEKEMSFCLLRFNWFFPWQICICQNNTVKMIISRLIVYVESSKVVVVFCCLSLSGESTKTSI